MPSFIVHGLIPLLLLLALRLVPTRVALTMLPLTWLPDLDYWIGIHRATTSNVFILLPFLLGWYLYRETRPSWSPYFAAATFYLASHILMDVFVGGVVLFWPLWDRTFFWFIAVVVNTQTGEVNPINEVGSESGAPPVSEFFTWISPFETAMLALTLVVVGGTLAYRWYRARPAVVLEELDG